MQFTEKAGGSYGRYLIMAILLLTLPTVAALNATIAYRSNTADCPEDPLNCPKIRRWDETGQQWGPEIVLPPAGSRIRYMVLKYSTVSPKRVLVTLAKDGQPDGYVCMKPCHNPDSLG